VILFTPGSSQITADKNYIPHVRGHNAIAGTVCLCDGTCVNANDTVPTQLAVILRYFPQILNVLGQNFPG